MIICVPAAIALIQGALKPGSGNGNWNPDLSVMRGTPAYLDDVIVALSRNGGRFSCKGKEKFN